MSAALSFFSGCSFAQPSGLAPFGEKPHFALNQGTPTGCIVFFPRRFTLIATSFRYVPSLNSRVYGGCSIAATPPLRSSKNNNFRYRYNYHFLRCLGVFDCRFQKDFPEKRDTTFFCSLRCLGVFDCRFH
jgi:hypothetical protein